MANLRPYPTPTPAFRVPPEDPPQHLDSLDIWESRLRDTTRRNEFLTAHTTLRSLTRSCQPYSRCNARLCPSCDYRHAAAARKGLRAPMPRTLQLTLTLVDSDDVRVGFENLNTVRRQFERLLRGHHLVVAYVVSFELTVSDLWHWHLHAAVFGNDLEHLAHELPNLWVESAASLGFHASSYAQDAVLRDAKGALAYAVKSKLNRGSGSLWELLGRAADGEDERPSAAGGTSSRTCSGGTAGCRPGTCGHPSPRSRERPQSTPPQIVSS
jgi:hypothetical protein